MSWIFQQDNAKPHTSRVVTTAWLKAQRFIVMKCVAFQESRSELDRESVGLRRS